MKIFGPGSHPGGVFNQAFPWGQNGLGENFDVGCRPSISVRGAGRSPTGYRCLGLWLTVPLFVAWQGAGAGRQRYPGRFAGAGAPERGRGVTGGTTGWATGRPRSEGAGGRRP